MAIDNPTLMFLLGLRNFGLPFSDTLTLGRQQLNVDRPDLVALLKSEAATRSSWADDFLKKLGVTLLRSMDKSEYESASIKHDLNEPIEDAWHLKFDTVFDGGTLEHILNFPCAVRSAMQMVKVGGHFLSVAVANNYMGHGFYQFSPELFYRVFSQVNGFRVRAMLLHERKPKGRWFLVMDPNDYGRRVELRNAEYTYMFTVAERIDLKPIFSEWPTQSDYTRLHRGSALSEKAAPASKSLLGSLKQLFPNSVKHSVKKRLGMDRDDRPFSESCFRPLSEDEILAGKFIDSAFE